MLRYRSTWVVLCHIVMLMMIFLPGCKEGQVKTEVESLQKYFYPLEKMTGNGQEYRYSSDIDPNAPPEIWIHKFISPDIFESTNVDSEGKMILRQKDKVVSNGVMMDSMILSGHLPDTTPTLINVKVLKPNRFSFSNDTLNYVTQLDWVQTENDLHIVLNRNRKVDSFLEYEWQGKKYKAVKLYVYDTLETEQTGWSKTEWRGYEIFAEGLGLVHYERQVNKNMRISYSLSSVKAL